LTADLRGIGSSPGSNTTSLGSPRMVVVHGPMSVRRRRGIAASRERTTTGRRPMSGSSHHQTSPRVGVEVTTRQLRRGTTRGRPTRLLRRAGGRRRRRTPSRSLPPGWHERVRRGRRRTTPSRSHLPGGLGLRRAGRHRRWCSRAHEACHNYATPIPHQRRAPMCFDLRWGEGATFRPGSAVRWVPTSPLRSGAPHPGAVAAPRPPPPDGPRPRRRGSRRSSRCRGAPGAQRTRGRWTAPGRTARR